MKVLVEAAEKRWMPDGLIRYGIRRQLRDRLRSFPEAFDEHKAAVSALVEQLKGSPVALSTREANEQHYEVPAEFFQLALGPRLKYSCAWYDDSVKTLGEAEERMLALTCERAELEDGQSVLELGCGWGSLTLWMAEKYPNSQITGVSNSSSQRDFILERARVRGLSNVSIITADMNAFNESFQVDRVVSIEMFEHMRNYAELMKRISGWLKPGGKLFVHIFTHKEFPYTFDTGDRSGNWMANTFFTNGIMPSDNLLLNFQDHVSLERTWTVDGTHYSKTAEDWLRNTDANLSRIREIFADTYGADSERWVQRWRMFFMACAELWGYRNGSEWRVVHYLFERKA